MNRWDGITDEELGEIYSGAIDRKNNDALSDEARAISRKLVLELMPILSARRGGYRGAGVYAFYASGEFEVLGILDIDPPLVIFRAPGDNDLRYEALSDFNDRTPRTSSSSLPRYTYLRPLGEE